MIISRTPYRISFFGGGTDYPGWYRQHGGEVLATTIDKYCYITCRHLPPFFEHKYRVVYSRIEEVEQIDDIKHPAVRGILSHLAMSRGVEIHHDGDLPARSGMGSSSSFTVGVLNALHALSGRVRSKHQLAMEAIDIEQNVLRETVGSQDQVSAAYGGFNHIEFHQNGEVSVKPITISRARLGELDSHLMLFYSGIKRTASDVATSYVEKIGDKKRQLRILRDMVREAVEILSSDRPIRTFGELLNEAWMTKRSLSSVVSNDDIDTIYADAISEGAVGGKLLGAGGGGFVLLFVPPERQEAVRQKLSRLLHVPFRFEYAGSQVIFYDVESDYSEEESHRARAAMGAWKELNA
jgi:D-glycero-alpha-D-manno-heptose-7-phosphate kinase